MASTDNAHFARGAHQSSELRFCAGLGYALRLGAHAARPIGPIRHPAFVANGARSRKLAERQAGAVQGTAAPAIRFTRATGRRTRRASLVGMETLPRQAALHTTCALHRRQAR